MRTFVILLALAGCDADGQPLIEGNVDALLFAAGPTLSHTPLVDNGTGVLSIDGAQAFEDVAFLASGGPGMGPCPAVLGGTVCVSLVSPKVLAIVQADAAGHAEYVMNVPGALNVGDAVALQAAVPRGLNGVDSVVSNVAVTVVVSGSGIDDDGDGFDVTVDCDDTNPVVYPGALEICDGADNDCNVATSEDGLITANLAVNYALVADAILFSPDDSLINVCAGTYPEEIVIDKPIELVGVGAPGTVVFDGSASNGRMVELGSLSDGSVIRNITYLQSMGTEAIYLGSTTVELDRVVVTQSDVSNVPIYHSSTVGLLTLNDCVVSDNVGANGGGVRVYADLVANRSAFTGNTTISGGSAIETAESVDPDVDLVDCVVESNSGGTAALHVGDDTSSTITVTNTDFGVGGTENLPADVYIEENGVSYFTYQAGATFTCDWLSCF